MYQFFYHLKVEYFLIYMILMLPIIIMVNSFSHFSPEFLMDFWVHIIPFFWIIKNMIYSKCSFKQLFQFDNTFLNRSFIIINFLLVLLTISFTNIINILYEITSDDIVNNELYGEQNNNLTYTMFNIIMIVIVGPIIEEIIFRGLFLYKLVLRVNIKLAIITTSLMFSVLHQDIIGAFIFSVIISIICLKTNSIIYPIMSHIFSNLITIIYNVLYSDLVYYVDANHLKIAVFLSCIFLFFCIIYLINYIKKNLFVNSDIFICPVNLIKTT